MYDEVIDRVHKRGSSIAFWASDTSLKRLGLLRQTR